MTTEDERDSFLAAIRHSPDDDIHRLVFADWLDERPDDHSRATAEFIRLGCGLDAGKTRQSRAEGRWLGKNSHLLVPRLAGHGFKAHRRSGRVVYFNCEQPFTRRDGTSSTYLKWCIVTFWRGFASRIEAYRVSDLDAIQLVGWDQPLVRYVETQDTVWITDDAAEVAESRYSGSGVPANDIFDRLVSPDSRSDGELRYKRFPRLDDESTWDQSMIRARIALSIAIRGWIDATRPGGAA